MKKTALFNIAAAAATILAMACSCAGRGDSQNAEEGADAPSTSTLEICRNDNVAISECLRVASFPSEVTVENPHACAGIDPSDTSHAEVRVSAIIRNSGTQNLSVRVMTSIKESESMRSEIPVQRVMNNLNVISASTALNVFVGKERKLSEVVQIGPGEQLSVSKVFNIDNPRLWAANGEACRNVYDIRIAASVAGEENDAWEFSIGILKPL